MKSACSDSSTTPDPASMSLLDGIITPQDVKSLSEEQLPVLAEEIRTCLIEELSKTGGHLGPNLGVVELTIALHRAFSTPGGQICV